jgi:hypothetical protein
MTTHASRIYSAALVCRNSIHRGGTNLLPIGRGNFRPVTRVDYVFLNRSLIPVLIDYCDGVMSDDEIVASKLSA